MSRKDYELIARCIYRERGFALANSTGDYQRGKLAALHGLAGDLAADLAGANPRFNRAKFLAACGVED